MPFRSAASLQGVIGHLEPVGGMRGCKAVTRAGPGDLLPPGGELRIIGDWASELIIPPTFECVPFSRRRLMRDTTVLIFGAGATKDCGGPLTNEILAEAFQAEPNLHDQQQAIRLLREFLDENFPLRDPQGNPQRNGPQDYPSLSLLLSLLDTAIDRKEPFGRDWANEKVAQVRQAVEAAIFAVLDFRSPQAETSTYQGLLEIAYPGLVPEATVISLNYDMILDVAMFEVCQQRKPGSLPSYGCDIRTKAYQTQERWGTLLKLHGSVNWMYCSQCHQLEIGWSRRQSAPSPIGHYFFQDPTLDDQYSERSQCPQCKTRFRPILITPTYRKDYRNPHLARVWYEAERRPLTGEPDYLRGIQPSGRRCRGPLFAEARARHAKSRATPSPTNHRDRTG